MFSVIALAALAVLASSLHDVQFQPGRSFAIQYSTESPIPPFPTDSFAEIPLWKIILFWGVILISIISFVFLLPPYLRKRLLKQILSLGIGSLVFFIALHYRLIQLPQFGSASPAKSAQLEAGLDSNSSVPIFQPPAITPWMMYLISLGVLLALLLLAWIGYRYWMRSRPGKSSRLNDLAEIARSSLDELASGRDWSDVIVQSYVQMGDVVSEKRGLHRADAMTPREFAERLQYAGLPSEAVKRLTRLFESVRYGARESSQADVSEAIACLKSILQACGAA